MTYAANIFVDVEYVKGNQIYSRSNVKIGRIPVMLRSRTCILNGQNEENMAKMRECPLDPGGYFIINGTEKVILVQEQMSKNRIFVEKDNKGMLQAVVAR